jgi:hypothetical protein
VQVLAASNTVAEVLLVLKIAFIVLLYLFVLRVIRSAGRSEKSAPSQDSMILSPQAAAAAGLGRGSRRSFLLVVQRSPSLGEGDEFPVNSAPVTVGRGGQNDLVLTGDDFASARHARIYPQDGEWFVEDLGSTNGTFIGPSRLTQPTRLEAGVPVRVGRTVLELRR